MDVVRTLGEDLLLLTLNEKKGTIASTAHQGLHDTLAGAVIMDLALRDRLTMNGRALVVSNTSSTGDDLLDEALDRIASARRPRSAQHWVGNLRLRQYRRLVERLIARGVLRRQKGRRLGVFPYTRVLTQDPAAARELRQQVRTAVLGGNEIDTRTAFLLSLASACSVVGRLFSRDERRIAKKRIKAIIENELIGKAVNDAVTAAVLNAATAAAVAAAVAASTSSSG